MRSFRLTIVLLVLAFAGGALITPNQSAAASAAEISRDAKVALEKLYAKSPKAKTLGEKAKGILVFPGIAKGGFMVGANMVKALLSRMERLRGTTTPSRSLTVCRPAYRRTGMPCF